MSDRVKIGGEGMTVQSFSLEERRAYVKMVNNTLGDIEKCKKYLPCDPETDEQAEEEEEDYGEEEENFIF